MRHCPRLLLDGLTTVFLVLNFLLQALAFDILGDFSKIESGAILARVGEILESDGYKLILSTIYQRLLADWVFWPCFCR